MIMTESFINILLGLSVQAVIMGAVVILLQTFLRKQMQPKFIFLLWLLVFAKLMIPINFQSVFSVFQFFRQNEVMNGIITNRASEQINFLAQQMKTPYIPVVSETMQKSFNIYNLLFIVWFVVSVALVFIVFQYYYNVKINIFRHQKTEYDFDIIELADDCFCKTGIPRETEIVCSSYANTPFVFGLLKPLIVIPHSLFNAISKDELRLIIMHEAIHIKRYHYRLKFIVTFINIVHWYNPIVWYFSRIVDKEMEFDCDYALLKGKWPIQEVKYAETLLNIAKLQKNKFAFGITFGETNFIKRVAAIMLNKKFSNVLTIVSLTLVIVLSVGFFTLAKENSELNEKVQKDNSEAIEYVTASGNNSDTEFENETVAPKKADDSGFGIDFSLSKDGIDFDMDFNSQQSDGAYYMEILEGIYDNVNDNSIPLTTSNNNWVDYSQIHRSKESLQKYLTYKKEFIGNKKNIEKLEIRTDNCNVFFEYTDEDYIRMEFYTLSEENSKKFKCGISESGNTSTISVEHINRNGNALKDPNAAVIYIPRSINNFDKVSANISMGNIIVHEINTKNLTVDLSMSTMETSFDEIDGLDISLNMSNFYLLCGKINKKADINSSMSNMSIKFATEPDDLLVNGICRMSTDPSLPDGWSYNKKSGFSYTYGNGSKVMNINYDMSNLKIE